MKVRQSFIVAISSLSVSGLALAGAGGGASGGGGGRPQGSQGNSQRPQQSSSNNNNSSSSNGNSSQNSSSNSNSSGPDRRSETSNSNDKPNKPGNPNNSNPYGYPYGYGQPTAGVYYPQGSGYPSSSSGNISSPNANNPQPNANAPANTGNTSPFRDDSSAGANSRAPATTQPVNVPDPELAAATADYNAAMAQLKETLKARSDYAAVLAEKSAARIEAALLREKSEVNPADTLAVAQKGLDASKKLSVIEKEAMAKDPTVIAARARLDAALAAHNGATAR